MRDLLNNSTSKALVPATNTGNELETSGADATQEETSVDLIGEGRKCMLIISVGKTSSATLSLIVKSGTDNSTFGTTEVSAQILDTPGVTVIDFVPNNRYIRAEWTVSATGALGSHTYVDFSAVVVVYNERLRPSNVT